MRRKRLSILLTLAFLSIVFIACRSPSNNNPDPQAHPSYLRISPAALTLNTLQNASLHVLGFDDDGKQLDLKDLSFVWQRSDETVLNLDMQDSNAQSALVTALNELGSSVLSVKSVEYPELISPPIVVTIADIKQEVKQINDAEVIYPPVFIPPGATPDNYQLPHFTGSGDSLAVAGINFAEIEALYEVKNETTLLHPIILEGGSYQLGDLLLSTGEAGIMGRIIQLEQRDGLNLIQLEEVGLTDIYNDLKYSFSSEELLEQGIVTEESLLGLADSEDIAETLETLSNHCEKDFAGELIDFPTPLLDLQLKLILDAALDLEEDIYAFVLGFKLTAKVEPAFELQSALKGKIECKVGETRTLASIPFPGPLAALISGDLKVTPKDSISFDLSTGPRISGKATAQGSLLLQGGYDNRLDDATSVNTADLDGSMSASLSTPTNLTNALTDISFELQISFFESAQIGMQLGGSTANSARKLSKWLGVDFLTRIADALFLDVLKGDAGPRAKLTWESASRVMTNETSASSINLDSLFSLKIESSALNKVLKKFDLAPVSFELAREIITPARFHRVFQPDTISVQSPCFDGVASDEPVCVTEGNDATFTVKVQYKGDPMFIADRPLTEGIAYLAKNLSQKLTDMIVNEATNTMTANLIITDEMCEVGEINFLAFNEMLWLFDTAGYAGKVKLVCDPMLTVTTEGEGKVTSTPQGIDCPTSCEHEFPGGEQVTLTVEPETGWSFKWWEGACFGEETTCTLTMDRNKEVKAVFENEPPVAVLQATPESGESPLEVMFDASQSTDDSEINYYYFDYGDGSPVLDEIFPTATHTYQQEGEYTARLTVEDDGGLTSSDVVVIVVTLGVCGDDPEELVSIPDAALRQGIKDALGITTEPTCRDMTLLTELLLEDAGVSNLTGLEYAINLKTLNLNRNNIRGLSPLAGLRQLESLSLRENVITGISPLANLTNLHTLDFEANNISSITAVTGLTSLVDLNFRSNNITDISPVAGLTNLIDLDLQRNSITNASPVAGLTQLEELNLSKNAITDISPLANLTKLTYLGIQDNTITNIQPLANLTNLTGIDLDGNGLSDISALANLTKLEYLDLSYNNITNISALADLTNLTDLQLARNEGISNNISIIANLVNLERLEIYRNRLTRLTPLIQNPGIGVGDVIDVHQNCLLTTPQGLEDVATLRGRGVEVIAHDQRDCSDD